MKKYYEFKKYLESGWSEATASRYSSAIHIISNELFDYDLIECNIYMIDDTDTINNLLDKYLSMSDLEQKDIRGRRMYSNAIKRYVEFYNNLDH